ncbi:hypothetical protein [Aquirufa nivalisilvae]|uniref:hypothetical protein n=1 Tax=Aquirufa nivalisilvae TaxID=2516557 RepID=UPI0022A9E53A|nr:hypothetical protein [Aquirufa nivalisilvae]
MLADKYSFKSLEIGVMELKNIRLYRFFGVGETMVEDKKQTSDCHCKWMDISQITLNVMAKSFK